MYDNYNMIVECKHMQWICLEVYCWVAQLGMDKILKYMNPVL